MTVVELMALAKDLTVVVCLVVALWAGATKRWVWGYHYQEAQAREQWWRDYATALQDVTAQAVTLAEQRRSKP